MILPFIHAQNAGDVFNLTFTQPLGNARYMGMGGAFNALGNDMSGLHDNPAGIGVFRKQETHFTFSNNFTSINSDFRGNTAADDRNSLLFNNFGIVVPVENRNSNNKLLYGFSLQRLSNFNNRHLIEGSAPGSIAAEWFDRVNGLSVDRMFQDYFLEAELGYNTYLFDADENDIVNELVAFGDNIGRRHIREQSGNLTEFAFTLGGNSKNKLSWGAQLGIPFFNYSESIRYNESNFALSSDINQFQLNEFVDLRGTGINIKGGIIYKINQMFRVGATVHSPTFMSIRSNAEFRSQSEVVFSTGPAIVNSRTLIDETRFSVNTPAKIGLGAASVIENLGIISVDYELIDLSQSRLSSRQRGLDLTDANQDIRDVFNVVSRLKLGTEWRLEQFVARGGLSMLSSPFSFDRKLNYQTGIHMGTGYRTANFALDLSYTLLTSSREFFMYGPDYIDPTKQSFRTGIFSVSLIFRTDK